MREEERDFKTLYHKLWGTLSKAFATVNDSIGQSTLVVGYTAVHVVVDDAKEGEWVVNNCGLMRIN